MNKKYRASDLEKDWLDDLKKRGIFKDNMVPCNCPKGGIYEDMNGNTAVCDKCNGTEWVPKEIEYIFFTDGRHEKECPVCGIGSFSHQHLKGDKPKDYEVLPDNVMHLSSKLEDDCDWKKEFDNEFIFDYYDNTGLQIFGNRKDNCPATDTEIKDFIETLLIQILAKCESAKDAKECRHIIKDYILKP